MTRFYATVAACALSAALATPSAAVLVPSNSATPTFIGNVVAGTTYSITLIGQGNLYANFNGGAGLTFTADGKPTYAFPSPYSAFSPNGLSYDPSQGNPSQGNYVYCIGGASLLCGGLLGTYSAVGGSYFQLGGLSSFTATQTGSLYGVVNDVANGYGDNSADGFSIRIGATTGSNVPEPATWLLMVAGFGAIGGALRRRRAGVRFA